MPEETKEIFDTLRKGNFIVSDHPDSQQRRLYALCDSYHSLLFPYFEILGYELTDGDGYFVFHVPDMTDATKENRLTAVIELLGLFEMFHGLFPAFGVGWLGSQSDFATALKNDAVRSEKMENVRSGKGKSLYELSEKAFKDMAAFGILISTGDKQDNYKCVSSYNYARGLFEDIKMINAKEEVENG